MLNRIIEPRLTPILGKSAERVRQSGLTSTKLVLIALGLGLTGCLIASLQLFPLAIIFALLNRFVASIAAIMNRDTESNPLAAHLAPVCDYIFFGAFAFFFTLAAPEHSMAAAFLLFSYLAMGMASLSSELMVARLNGQERPKGGFIESLEITIFMIVCCLYPVGFSAFATLFAFLCWVTAIMRIVSMRKIALN